MLAGIRDASWYAYPSHDSRHWVPVFHVESEDFPGTSACMPDRVLLVDDSMVQAAEIPTDAQCRRPACRKRFSSLND